jgi:hypothetical protein
MRVRTGPGLGRPYVRVPTVERSKASARSNLRLVKKLSKILDD